MILHIDYGALRRLAEHAADVIDTTWKSSWHWKRTESGTITDEGWAQIERDCRRRIVEVEFDLIALKKLEERLNTELPESSEADRL